MLSKTTIPRERLSSSSLLLLTSLFIAAGRLSSASEAPGVSSSQQQGLGASVENEVLESKPFWRNPEKMSKTVFNEPLNSLVSLIKPMYVFICFVQRLFCLQRVQFKSCSKTVLQKLDKGTSNLLITGATSYQLSYWACAQYFKV